MLLAKKQRQAKYATLFAGAGWEPGQLSNTGWVGLIGVPQLLYEMENNGQDHGKDRNADCQPRPDCIGALQPALQLVLPKQTMTDTALVVPTGNPLAKLLVGFLAKAVGVSFVAHMMRRSTLEATGPQHLRRSRLLQLWVRAGRHVKPWLR
jgi:hypothetical protein